MRTGILSLIMPQSRKKKRSNITQAEQAATTTAKPILKTPLPAADTFKLETLKAETLKAEPVKAEPVVQQMEAPFVQRVYVPKTPSLLKSVTKKHDEMARKSRRNT